ncbi:hypothetical protein V8E54_014430 [Elaphomyces granulatus]
MATDIEAPKPNPSSDQSGEIRQPSFDDGERSNPYTKESSTQPISRSHQQFVFTDPIAFHFLEEDPSTAVLDRHTTLTGYEIYIVEQWACSRVHPTFIITNYTGDPKHTVMVGILSIPTEENVWSSPLKLYFHAVAQHHSRKDTPLGSLMVTNLSTFPSTLNVIPIPDGDIRNHREDFIVNENLKRLGCSGRAGLKLQYPSPVVEAKFYQLYRTSERVSLYTAVVELVKQCQIALIIFGKLSAEYADGLFCDVTERAISDWWTDIGTDFYNIEPSDGILGPTTVSALLGMLMGARNRLHAYGAPVPKDVFDVSSFKRGIRSFQKSQKINRTRRLDRQTLDKLHRATAKAASSEGWTGAVKSTVAELSGKGGEMVMGMVGGRDKAGITDIETLDIDRFVQLVSSERSKWLWQGKARKTGAIIHGLETVSKTEDPMSAKDDQGRHVWASRMRHSNVISSAGRALLEPASPSRQTDSTDVLDSRDQHTGKTVARSLTSKVSDAKAGFERFKGAVGLPGLRSHHKHTGDAVDLDSEPSFNPAVDSDLETPIFTHMNEVRNTSEQRGGDSKGLRDDMTEERYGPTSVALSGKPSTPENIRPESSFEAPVFSSLTPLKYEGFQFSEQENGSQKQGRSKSELLEAPTDQDQLQMAIKSLRRPRSYPEIFSNETFKRPGASWPRHLSFSTVEDVVNWEGEARKRILENSESDINLENALLQEGSLLSDTRIFDSKILELSRGTVWWAERQVDSVDDIYQRAYRLQEDLNFLYLQRFEKYRSLRERSGHLLSAETSRLTDNLKKVELLGAKLDYELRVLESKVEDVEDGLQQFERNVIEIESRIQDLVKNEESKDISWLSWVGRMFGRIQ